MEENPHGFHTRARNLFDASIRIELTRNPLSEHQAVNLAGHPASRSPHSDAPPFRAAIEEEPTRNKLRFTPR